ncbi:hypothetical protein PTKIN_Ptkin10aG0004200 [Pterospermum kingtungense]
MADGKKEKKPDVHTVCQAVFQNQKAIDEIRKQLVTQTYQSQQSYSSLDNKIGSQVGELKIMIQSYDLVRWLARGKVNSVGTAAVRTSLFEASEGQNISSQVRSIFGNQEVSQAMHDNLFMQKLFDKMPKKTLTGWNSIIATNAQLFDDGGERLIAQSFAERIGLNGEQVDILIIVCNVADVASRVESQFKLVGVWVTKLVIHFLAVPTKIFECNCRLELYWQYCYTTSLLEGKVDFRGGKNDTAPTKSLYGVHGGNAHEEQVQVKVEVIE